ncbi:hypothetical protein T492DRAFT_276921, partial [Pavlovales sp. CCMP2436]
KIPNSRSRQTRLVQGHAGALADAQPRGHVPRGAAHGRDAHEPTLPLQAQRGVLRLGQGLAQRRHPPVRDEPVHALQRRRLRHEALGLPLGARRPREWRADQGPARRGVRRLPALARGILLGPRPNSTLSASLHRPGLALAARACLAAASAHERLPQGAWQVLPRARDPAARGQPPVGQALRRGARPPPVVQLDAALHAPRRAGLPLPRRLAPVRRRVPAVDGRPEIHARQRQGPARRMLLALVSKACAKQESMTRGGATRLLYSFVQRL